MQSSLRAPYSLPGLIPCCRSSSFSISRHDEGVGRLADFNSAPLRPQTPFSKGSYKEPPYPAQTNSADEVETNAFVWQIYLDSSRHHPNGISHRLFALKKNRTVASMLASAKTCGAFSSLCKYKYIAYAQWKTTFSPFKIRRFADLDRRDNKT